MYAVFKLRVGTCLEILIITKQRKRQKGKGRVYKQIYKNFHYQDSVTT